MEIIDYAIDKLIALRIQAEFEDMQRGKKRYVSKVSAYKDLIKLLEELKQSGRLNNNKICRANFTFEFPIVKYSNLPIFGC